MGLLGGSLFVLALLISILLHEIGHLVAARRAGGKVTAFFVGFGPRLWSFRRGETEYGVKALPAGGYVKVVGTTDLEPIDPEDEPRAFYHKSLKAKLVFWSAGSAVHFAIALILLALVPIAFGNEKQDSSATIGYVSDCVKTNLTDPACDPKAPTPAKSLGLTQGDRVTAVNGTPVTSWNTLTDALHALPVGRPATVTWVHAGRITQSQTVPVASQGYDTSGTKVDYAVIGIGPAVRQVRENPATAIGGAFTQFGSIAKSSVAGLVDIPASIPRLVGQIGSHKPRTSDTPVSVVGMASLSGGMIHSGGYGGFLTFIASINVFLGIFNLLPIMPLDGGKAAVAVFEHARRRVARLRGRPDPGNVDLGKMVPVAFGFLVLFAGLSVLLAVADIVNPLRFTG